MKEKLVKEKKRFKLDLHKRNSLKGLVFVAPFIVGIVLFFIYPIYMSIRLSISEQVAIVGMKMQGFTLEHFVRAFVVDTEFVPTFIEVVKQTLTKCCP